MAEISIVKFSKLGDYFGRIDAEFFRPSSLYADELIKSFNYSFLGRLVNDGYRVVYENTKILPIDKLNPTSDARFMQATNISPDGLWIDVSEIGFVHEKDWNNYPKGRIRHGEILIEVKGQAEKVTIVQDYVPIRTLITGSVFKLSLKPKPITHEFLFAFFNCKYGKILRDRTKVNTLIAYVSKPELYRIPVPIPDEINLQLITDFVKLSFFKQRESQLLYTQANQLLEQALGIDKINFEKPKSYTANFSDSVLFSRFDSEYYKPKYLQLKEHIKNYPNGWEYLQSNIESLSPNFNPYVQPNDNFNYIELAGINSSLGLVNESSLLKGKEAPSRAKRLVKEGDIIASAVVGSVEKTAIISHYENNFLASSGFFHFRSKYYDPNFLIILIKSIVVTEQLRQEATGGILSAVPDPNLRRIIIPKVPKYIQDEIANNVKQSHIAYRQSKQLLEQAKTSVENLIEQAAL